MNFNKLQDTIPYVTGGKVKVLTMNPYPRITLAMPGRHAKDTIPVGGDFVVMIDDPVFNISEHQFTHTDIFNDLQLKVNEDPAFAAPFMADYLSVITGSDPEAIKWVGNYPGIVPDTFLRAVQCLAVAEHRRYAQYEKKFGGRYLPFRFGAGIVEGLWSASAAVERQNKGRPGVEWLEKDYGVPILTKVMMNG